MKWFFSISGQCPSGKNSVIVTRTGQRFPSKRFKEWRDKALAELALQKKPAMPIDKPVHVDVYYSTADNRRRDMPGLLDALWHVLERANIVTDDTFLGGAGTINKFKNLGNTGCAAISIEIEA